MDLGVAVGLGVSVGFGVAGGAGVVVALGVVVGTGVAAGKGVGVGLGEAVGTAVAAGVETGFGEGLAAGTGASVAEGAVKAGEVTEVPGAAEGEIVVEPELFVEPRCTGEDIGSDSVSALPEMTFADGVFSGRSSWLAFSSEALMAGAASSGSTVGGGLSVMSGTIPDFRPQPIRQATSSAVRR